VAPSIDARLVGHELSLLSPPSWVGPEPVPRCAGSHARGFGAVQAAPHGSADLRPANRRAREEAEVDFAEVAINLCGLAAGIGEYG
jgi:hypothetical protein